MYIKLVPGLCQPLPTWEFYRSHIFGNSQSPPTWQFCQYLFLWGLCQYLPILWLLSTWPTLSATWQLCQPYLHGSSVNTSFYGDSASTFLYCGSYLHGQPYRLHGSSANPIYMAALSTPLSMEALPVPSYIVAPIYMANPIGYMVALPTLSTWQLCQHLFLWRLCQYLPILWLLSTWLTLSATW